MFASVPDKKKLIDSHCHLDAMVFDENRDQVVAQAQQVGIGQILVPATCATSLATAAAMRARYGCWVAFGLHPCFIKQHVDDHLDVLERYVACGKPVAVGEIGLDFYLPHLDPAQQEALLIEQLSLARKYNLPVLLHGRRSQDRLLKYLRQIRVVGGIVHAFNGSEQQACAFLKLGFKLGFGGAMTYSGSRRIRHLVANLPLSALVLETDAPDMMPAWGQGYPNHPAALARIAQVMAQLRGSDDIAIVVATHANTLQALGLGMDG